jgi:ATP-dependent exoDNAse (exonuclease V) alpha subunit
MTQKEAFKILNSGHNVLLTGAAGSGKTYLLNQYINSLKERGIGVAITASTGIAATHIGGRTIHSWSGIGIKDSLSRKDLQNLAKRSYLKKQFEKTEVLIIDEISMLSAHHLDMINAVCQTLKKNSFPFGGLQIVMSGDFFQLPPITRNDEELQFVYQAQVWSEMDVRVCYLQEQYRQNDKSLMSILQALRKNEVDSSLSNLLAERLGQVNGDKIKAIRLFTHNIDVDAINQAELDKIDEDEHRYFMTSDGEERLVAALKKNCLAPSELILKKGALVMFVKNKFKNDEAVYVNGSAGIVVGFEENSYPLVRLNNNSLITVSPERWTIDDEEKVLARINQLPLRLAWAITVHKSQGMTLEKAEIDLSRAFTYGMGYVALSRLTTLKGLYLRGINDMAYQVNPQVLDYNEELLKLSQVARKQKKSTWRKEQGSLV